MTEVSYEKTAVSCLIHSLTQFKFFSLLFISIFILYDICIPLVWGINFKLYLLAFSWTTRDITFFLFLTPIFCPAFCQYSYTILLLWVNLISDLYFVYIILLFYIILLNVMLLWLCKYCLLQSKGVYYNVLFL